MVEWLTIVLLISAGIILVLIEVLFVPGTTIVGIIGGAVMVFGIILAYADYGSGVGNWVLLGSVLAGGLLIFVGIRQGSWKKFALQSSISSRVNEDVETNLFEGDTGTTVSALRPFGKAEFGDRMYEVRTIGNYVPSGTEVKVTKIDEQKRIFVEPVN